MIPIKLYPCRPLLQLNNQHYLKKSFFPPTQHHMEYHEYSLTFPTKVRGSQIPDQVANIQSLQELFDM